MSEDRVNPIVRFAVDRRVTMAMAVLGVLVLGWLSLTRLPLEFLPSFSSSFVTVNAPYAASSPQESVASRCNDWPPPSGSVGQGS